MSNGTVYSKTAKGVQEAAGKTRNVSRYFRGILRMIDGKMSVTEMQQKDGNPAELLQALNTLVAEGYIREVVTTTFPEVAGGGQEDLDFTSLPAAPAPPPAPRETEERAKREAAEQAQQAAEEQIKQLAKEVVRREARERTKREAAEQAQREAEDLARRQAEEASRRANEERAKREAAERAQREAEQTAKRLAEEARQREADERTRREAAEQAQRKAEEQARQQIEEAARRANEERVKREAAEKEAARLAEEAARRADEERVKREAAEQAQREAEKAAKRIAEEAARREAEEGAQRAADERAKREAAEQAQRKAEEQARQRIEEAARQANEERAKREAAEQAQREAEKAARRIAEEAAQREDRARREAEKRVWQQAEEAAQRTLRDAEKRARKQAEEATREHAVRKQRESDERARQKAKSEAERVTEERARRAEAKEASRRAAEQASRRRDEQRAADQPMVRGRRSPLNKLAVGALTAVIVLGLVLIHIVPFNGRIPQLEAEMTERLQQPVRINALHFALLPRPHWRIEDVSIGAAKQIQAARVDALMTPSALFGDQSSFSAIDVDAPTLNVEGLGWLLFGTQHGADASLRRLSAHGVRLEVPGMTLPALEVNAEIGDGGQWQRIAAAAAEKKLALELRRNGEAFDLRLDAAALAAPVAGMPELQDVTARGTLTRGGLSLAEFQAGAFGGTLNGAARMRWDGVARFDGELLAQRVEVAQVLPGHFANGLLEGKAMFSLPLPPSEKASSESLLSGSFIIRKGTLATVDIGRVLLGDSAGRTSFSTLEGSLAHDRGKTQLRQLRLVAGAVVAQGNMDIASDNSLRGNVAIDLNLGMQRRRGDFEVSGVAAGRRAESLTWKRH